MIKKVWQVLYPIILYFLLDVLVVWAVTTVLTPGNKPSETTPAMGGDTGAIATIVFLVLSILMCGYLYMRDPVIRSGWMKRKPVYWILLFVTGALVSHGLSALVSLFEIDQVMGDYTELESIIFSAKPVLVCLQTIILAPISEELLFRGLVFQRLRFCIRGFWGPALISSALFGLYHMNLSQGIFAFLFGLLACAVYDRFRNLAASILLHAGGNLLSVALVYAGFEYPSKALFIICMAASLAAAAAIYIFLLRPVAGKTDRP